jgi:hypothetical protein
LAATDTLISKATIWTRSFTMWCLYQKLPCWQWHLHCYQMDWVSQATISRPNIVRCWGSSSKCISQMRHWCHHQQCKGDATSYENPLAWWIWQPVMALCFIICGLALQSHTKDKWWGTNWDLLQCQDKLWVSPLGKCFWLSSLCSWSMSTGWQEDS